MGVVGLLGAVRVGRWWINVFQARTKIAPNREWRDAQPPRESFPISQHHIGIGGNIYFARLHLGLDLRSCAAPRTLHD